MHGSSGMSEPRHQSGIPENDPHRLDAAGGAAMAARLHLVVGGHFGGTLSGSTGDDIIVGGAGVDTIYGDGLEPADRH